MEISSSSFSSLSTVHEEIVEKDKENHFEKVSLEHALHDINEQLSLLYPNEYPNGLSYSNDKENQHDNGGNHACFIDCIQKLLSSHVTSRDQSTLLVSSLSQMEKEKKRISTCLLKAEMEVDKGKENHAFLLNKTLSKEKQNGMEKTLLKEEKREMEKKVFQLTNMDHTYKALLKKKEMEYLKLQKTLSETLKKQEKKCKGITGNIILVNAPTSCLIMQKEVTERRKTIGDALTNQMLKCFEEKETQLLEENNVLKSELKLFNAALSRLGSDYQKTVRLFMARGNLKQESSHLLLDTMEESLSLPNGALELPFSKSTNVAIHFTTALQALREKMNTLMEKAQGDEEDTQYLHEQLSIAKDIIKEQDTLLQTSLKGSLNTQTNNHNSMDTNPTRLDYSELDLFEEDLQVQKTALQNQQIHLEEERKMLLETATKLDTDRVKFEQTKQDAFFGVMSSSPIPALIDLQLPVPRTLYREILIY